MPSLSPPLLVLLIVATSPPTLARPVEVADPPAPVAAVRASPDADDAVVALAERAHRRVLHGPLATVESGEQDCQGVAHEVDGAYVRVTGDLARCLPSLATDPGPGDLCTATGNSCCERWGARCLEDVFARLLGKLSGKGPVVQFCIGTTRTQNGSVEPQVELGKPCGGSPSG